ncbi:MAG: PilN domain-containing protein [Deltaproteobacteria bacterium]|nr:PilN domain-containing protein [Deltaproteobacteria bacterium]
MAGSVKMFHPFKAFIVARSVVGLEINRHSIGAVQVSHSSGGPEIERLALRQIEDPDQLDMELKDFVRAEALHPEMLITSLPTSLASIRELHLPFANTKKIREIIKYQMEPLVPYNVEDMVVDMLPSAKGEPITAIGVEKRVLSDHLKTLGHAELEPNRVGLHDLALFSLFLKTQKQKPGEPIAIVRLDEEEMAFQVILDGRIAFIRILPCKKDPLDTLKECLRLYAMKSPQDTLTEIYVTGPLAIQEDMVDRIGGSLGIKTSLWRPFEGVKHKNGKIEDNLQAMLSVPLALALSAGNGSEKSFDLRREEFAPKTAGNFKGPLLYLFSALILFMGLWTFHLYQKLNVEDDKYKGLNNGISRVFTETFPGARHIIKGRELEQMRQRIGEEKGKYQWLNQVTAQGLVLETLLSVTKVVSGLRDVKIDNISIDGSAVHLDGRTSSFKTVDDLKGRLSGLGAFSSVKLVGAKMDNRENDVMFSFALEKKP